MKEVIAYVNDPKKYDGIEGSISEEVKKNYPAFVEKCKVWASKHK